MLSANIPLFDSWTQDILGKTKKKKKKKKKKNAATGIFILMLYLFKNELKFGNLRHN